MKRNLRYFFVLFLALMGMAQHASAFSDIKVDLMNGNLTTADEQVQWQQLPDIGLAVAADGTVSRVAADAAEAVAVITGKWHSAEHGWAGFKATVPVEGPVKITMGTCAWGGNVTVKNAEGQEVVPAFTTNTGACYHQDKAANVVSVYYKGEATTLTIEGGNYTPYFAVEAVKTSWDDEAATATFPFDLGKEDQKADFGDADAAFLSSKIVHGSTLTINGTSTHADIVETTFQSAEVNEKEANEGNAIKFIIRPYPGLVFTPSKVSFRATRYGTDSGSLDIAWMNPDGTTLSLATNQTLNRNNAAAPSNFCYVLTDATPGEGECGLLLNLYNVFEGKSMGFGNIVIEGTLKGDKQEIPVLATVTANGITYDVEKTFEIVGDDYVATIELFSTDKMVSAENPVTVEVKEGKLGDITYEGDDQKTVVTIPVTHNDISMKWVANFVRKPFYTLTFLDADGKTVLGTQTIEKDLKVEEFAVSADQVTVEEGYTFRGWTAQLAGLNTIKVSANSTFQADTKLYPYITATEVSTPTARYDYDLTNPNFDPADHELITIEGGRYYNTHGWVFNGGDKVKLTLAGKGYIKLGLCLYSNTADIVVTDPKGNEISKFSARGNADGASTTVEYEGEAGDLTIAFPAGGATYMHSFSIRNMAEDPYTKAEGSNIYVVKLGATDTENGSNLLSMLELANGLQGSDRAVIFLPNATYDLGETVLTAISRNNVSLVGQSMEGTIIKNAPDRSIEGIGTTATLVNTSTGLYLQDLTLQNALDYYGAIGGGQVGGRAVCLWDKGKQTISKNVRMLSYQDTYYSNSNSQFYWETSEIHGTVDYLCGGGDVFYEKVKFVNESRALNGKSGSDVIAAPYTDSSSKFGYVFNNCEIENLAASFSLGRSWGGLSKLTYLNTVINQPDEIIDSRFTLGGMNVAAYSFKEYNSLDKDGNVVSPASLVETFTHGNGDYTYDIILSADEAAAYTLDKVFADWTPDADAKQADAPTAAYADGTIKWNAVEGATAYALFKNGELLAVTDQTSYAVTDGEKDQYTLRAANKMGGFGQASFVSGTNGINAVDAELQGKEVIYNLQGVRVNKAGKGIYIINGKKVIR